MQLACVPERAIVRNPAKASRNKRRTDDLGDDVSNHHRGPSPATDTPPRPVQRTEKLTTNHLTGKNAVESNP